MGKHNDYNESKIDIYIAKEMPWAVAKVYTYFRDDLLLTTMLGRDERNASMLLWP